MLPYAFAIFTGAFLLFQVQPLIGKYILPWFGGGPGVWTTCLLFFQLLLLGGYAYAHFVSTRLKPRTQAIVHCVLLVAAAAMLPIAPGDFWKAHIAGNPTWHIILLLGGTIGIPYFILSSTGPLMQQWFSTTNPGVSPYRLYALSNIGSLLALLSYPPVFEVRFTRYTQAALWSAAFVVFALLCAYCAWKAAGKEKAEGLKAEGLKGRSEHPTANVEGADDPNGKAGLSAEGSAETEPPTSNGVDPKSEEREIENPTTSGLDRFLWVALPAIACVLLMATTNKLCQEIAVIPFLWVLPLSLYLLTFVICFDHARWYSRGVFTALLAVAMAVVFQLMDAGNSAPMMLQIVCYNAALFIACMFCHGELYRLKPQPRHLTGYYLALSAGGALGGILVAVVAPAVFTDYRELPIGLWVLSYLAGVVCFRHSSRDLAVAAAIGLMLATFVMPAMRMQFSYGEGYWDEWRTFYTHYKWIIFGGITFFLLSSLEGRARSISREWTPRLGGFVMGLSVCVAVVVIRQWHSVREVSVLEETRNFYGTLKVFDYNPADPDNHYYLLLHGATTHGMQFVDPEKAMRATTYYGVNSGVGLAIQNAPRPEGQRRIGLVGLGTGTLASYGRPGDYIRIYEINPAVHRLATTRFEYLRRCQATVDVIMGDARLSMERELAAGEPQKFDVLALDAFSSDSIPVHLLTREAFGIYLKQLKPDGVLAVHTSNRYLNLRPVVERLAAEYGLKAATISIDDEPDWWVYRTTWILVTRNQAVLDVPAIKDVSDYPSESTKEKPLWTDDYASLYQILK